MTEELATDAELLEDDTQNKSEWLSFSLGSITYAVDILRVREIRIWESMTRVPYAQHFILGLINIRGAIVPIIDLRRRFGLPIREADKETIVLILNVVTEQGEKTMGIVVDQISEVVNLADEDIKNAEKFDLSVADKFVTGIADIRGAMSVLLDIDAVLDIADF
ncbi:chemotaxis protein CheW [Alteromonas facilis]|uniref:chemotaxis protein CheW n=1 Tax=Alteromonas facilis TaxID=2048004 RepID=UPI000C282106|nr:chemotaxis protein CheW [Alteromonas facilis]